jgi:hypothetical protein
MLENYPYFIVPSHHRTDWKNNSEKQRRADRQRLAGSTLDSRNWFIESLSEK